MSTFDDDVSRKMDELRAEKLKTQAQAEHDLEQVRSRYARVGHEVAQALNTSPFVVFMTEVSPDAEDWDYELALPDEGFCIVIQWRDSEEEIGIVTMDIDDGRPLFEPCPDHDVSSFLSVVSGHDGPDFAREVREMLVRGLAEFAISKDT